MASGKDLAGRFRAEAREWLGFTVTDVAGALHCALAVIEGYEDGTTAPGVIVLANSAACPAAARLVPGGRSSAIQVASRRGRTPR